MILADRAFGLPRITLRRNRPTRGTACSNADADAATTIARRNTHERPCHPAPDFRRQRAVGIAGIAVASLFASGLWFGIDCSCRQLPGMDSLGARMLLTLKCCCAAVLFCLVTGIEAVAHERLTSPAFDPLVGFETRRLRVNQRYLQNTLEQIGRVRRRVVRAGRLRLPTARRCARSWRRPCSGSSREPHSGSAYRSAALRGLGAPGMAISMIVLLIGGEPLRTGDRGDDWGRRAARCVCRDRGGVVLGDAAGERRLIRMKSIMLHGKRISMVAAMATNRVIGAAKIFRGRYPASNAASSPTDGRTSRRDGSAYVRIDRPAASQSGSTGYRHTTRRRHGKRDNLPFVQEAAEYIANDRRDQVFIAGGEKIHACSCRTRTRSISPKSIDAAGRHAISRMAAADSDCIETARVDGPTPYTLLTYQRIASIAL